MLKYVFWVLLATISLWGGDESSLSKNDVEKVNSSCRLDRSCGSINNFNNISFPEIGSPVIEKNTRVNWELIGAVLIGFLTTICSLWTVSATIKGAKIREKNNIISKARIEWAQELRKSFSELPNLIFVLVLKYKLMKKNCTKLKKEKYEKQIRTFLDENIKELSAIEGLCAYAKLHLNPKESDTEHKYLKELIDQLNNSISYENFQEQDGDEKIYCILEKLMSEASRVIKQAWEDAKNKEN